tara:strand:+ start:799 stop:1173 length:375 start_codon:yes stop_codon:yes gene_type:complete
MNDPLEGYNDLNEQEQYLLEQELLKRAFTNSFQILTKRKTMNEIVKDTGGLLMSHDPFKKLKGSDLANMLDFFIEEEDYEKCAEVRDLINKINAKNARKQKKDSTQKLGEILNSVIRGTKKSKS